MNYLFKDMVKDTDNINMHIFKSQQSLIQTTMYTYTFLKVRVIGIGNIYKHI